MIGLFGILTSPRGVVDPPKAAAEVYVAKQRVEYKGVQPIQVKGKLLIPLRETVEAMGGTVASGPIRRRIYITRGSTRVELSLDGSRSRVNGAPRVIRAAPWMSKGRVMVPLRFFSDVLRANTINDPRHHIVQIFPHGK